MNRKIQKFATMTGICLAFICAVVLLTPEPIFAGIVAENPTTPGGVYIWRASATYATAHSIASPTISIVTESHVAIQVVESVTTGTEASGYYGTRALDDLTISLVGSLGGPIITGATEYESPLPVIMDNAGNADRLTDKIRYNGIYMVDEKVLGTRIIWMNFEFAANSARTATPEYHVIVNTR